MPELKTLNYSRIEQTDIDLLFNTMLRDQYEGKIDGFEFLVDKKQLKLDYSEQEPEDLKLEILAKTGEIPSVPIKK